MTKQIIMELSGRMLILSIWVEVDGIEDKVPYNYQKIPPVDLPLEGEGVQIMEVSRVPINQPWLEDQGGVTKQEGQEEV